VRAQPPELTRRLFFALCPTPAESDALSIASAAAVQVCGGRAVPARNLHVTLAFLGAVPVTRIDELAALGRAVAAAWRSTSAPPLTLRFEALAHWQQPGILCALAGTEAVQAGELAAALKDAAALAGFRPDLKPFRAHVTVARKVARAPARVPLVSVTWKCTAIALMESRTTPQGAIYSILDSPLLGDTQK
jgi:RNA 2',3'-cyclic 3'-phosphodiesterase